MYRRMLVLLLSGVLVFSLAGCATFRKTNTLESQGLKNQVSVMQSQIQSKDEEINSLKEELAKAQETSRPSETEESKMKREGSDSVTHPSVIQIQTALKNASFDPGVIDGKMGQKTREAVRAFQKANHLKVNGKVNKKTWSLLKEYLNKIEK